MITATTRSVQISTYYRNGVHIMTLRAYEFNGTPTDKTRARVTSNPRDHEPILRMYERQTGRVVLRDSRRQTTTSHPYGSWAYDVDTPSGRQGLTTA